MIAKERDPREHADERDARAAAGAAAELQMAFYLKREFEMDESVFIFNDLRFKADNDDAAQIDHLVLHRHGFVLIESKSVSSVVKINVRDEWTRVWNGQEQGMPSPIEQVRRQAKFLDMALDANAGVLLPKMLGLVQCRFGSFPTDILVAISDEGRIKPDTKILPEVAKADQIPGRVRALIKQYKAKSSLLNMRSDATLSFSDAAMHRIRDFLLEHHYPRQRIESVRKVAPVPQAHPPRPPSLPAAKRADVLTRGEPCSACDAEGQITWGRYGYYWKCPSPTCGKNTPIRQVCATCGGKLFLRKEGRRFFARCEKCQTPERLFADLA